MLFSMVCGWQGGGKLQAGGRKRSGWDEMFMLPMGSTGRKIFACLLHPPTQRHVCRHAAPKSACLTGFSRDRGDGDEEMDGDEEEACACQTASNNNQNAWKCTSAVCRFPPHACPLPCPQPCRAACLPPAPWNGEMFLNTGYIVIYVDIWGKCVCNG